MNHDESSEALLELWLVVATDKLTPYAQERLRSEIKSHFFDAVENHIADGLTQLDAQMTALKELGEAKTAAKRFRQRHLTVDEVNYIERWCTKPMSLLGFIGVFGSLILLLYYFYGSSMKGIPNPLRFSATMYALFSLSYTLSFLESRRKGQGPRLQFLLLLKILTELSFLLSLGGLYTSWSDLGLLVAMYVSAPELQFKYRILPKLQKTSDLWQEMPPTATS